MIEHTSRTVVESIFILPVKVSGHDSRKRLTRRGRLTRFRIAVNPSNYNNPTF